MTLGAYAYELYRRNRVLAVTAAVNVALMVVMVLLMTFDDRAPVLGIDRWVKPSKFAVSIALFAATLGWLLVYLRRSRPRAVTAVSWTVAIAMLGEIGIITMQAARGVRSHFNVDSALDGALFGTMGTLIALSTIAVAYATVLFLRERPDIGRAYLMGIRLGLLVFLLASAVGGLMISHGSHTVGTDDGGPGLPLVNWSTTGGDLRVAHFIGMHALQGLPLLGWMLDRAKVAIGTTVVRTTAAVWALLTLLATWGALAARPLLR